MSGPGRRTSFAERLLGTALAVCAAAYLLRVAMGFLVDALPVLIPVAAVVLITAYFVHRYWHSDRW